MSELISGKEAKLAWANGEDIEFKPKPDVYSWELICDKNTLGVFDDDELIFRRKPRTITINGTELAPCYSVGIDHIKHEVTIEFHSNRDACELHDLLLKIYGFRQ